MNCFQNILVGIDLSHCQRLDVCVLGPVNENTLRQARWLAHRSKGRLTLLAALNKHSQLWHLIEPRRHADLTRSVEEAANRVLEELVARERNEGIDARSVGRLVARARAVCDGGRLAWSSSGGTQTVSGWRQAAVMASSASLCGSAFAMGANRAIVVAAAISPTAIRPIARRNGFRCVVMHTLPAVSGPVPAKCRACQLCDRNQHSLAISPSFCRQYRPDTEIPCSRDHRAPV